MVHLSRLAEEITWWSNPRIGFVRASDAFSTGSSMMPNKKNPDPAELVRGKTARVIGELTGLLTLIKGLPLAYQKDMQDDKPPLFDATATLEASLLVMAGMVATLTVNREAMREAAGEGFTTATAVADALVRRGVPFRSAHHIVAALVAEAERTGCGTRWTRRCLNRRRASSVRRLRPRSPSRATPVWPPSCAPRRVSREPWRAATSSAEPHRREWPRRSPAPVLGWEFR